jgi:hypothetical protein
VISGGMRASTLIAAASAIVWSDIDTDGYKETGTVTVATTVTAPCEVRLYYPGHVGAEEWEIRPVQVTIAAGVATIVFRRELAVAQVLIEALLSPRAAVGTTDADFLSTVDVYRVWNDPQQQVQMLWEPFWSQCPSCSDGCPACAFSSQFGCLVPRRAETSVVAFQPATWNATTSRFDATLWGSRQQPDQLLLWYRAGLRDEQQGCPDLTMDPDWAKTVAYYASSMLDRPLCDCNPAFFKNWQQDMSFQSGADEAGVYRLPDEQLANPFGPRRGAINAWLKVHRPGASLVSAVGVI